MSIEDKAILSTLVALFNSFPMQKTTPLKHDPEAKILITGLNDFFFNNICLKKPNDPEQLIKELKSVHRALAKPLMVWITPETQSPGLNEKMQAHFDTHGAYYGMLLDVNEAQCIKCPESISIEAVQTETAAAEYTKLFCDVFQLNNIRDAMKTYVIQQYQSQHPDAINYIAKINGQPAGVCTLTLNRTFSEFKTGGFYNTCVLPEYRNSGVATAMASHRVEEAKALGIEYLSVILMSDAMARGYCERLGFKNHQTLTPFFLQ